MNNWKDKRINEINEEIKKNKHAHGYYIDEYSDILTSKAKNLEEFKKERGEIWVILNIIFR